MHIQDNIQNMNTVPSEIINQSRCSFLLIRDINVITKVKADHGAVFSCEIPCTQEDINEVQNGIMLAPFSILSSEANQIFIPVTE